MRKELIMRGSSVISGLFFSTSIVANPSNSAWAESKTIKTTELSDRVYLVDTQKALVQKSRDGRYLFLFDTAPILVDTIKGTTERIGTKEYPASRNIAITDDGRFIIYSSYGLGIVIYDRVTKEYRNIVEDDDKYAGKVRVSGDGRYIAFETSSQYLERRIPEKLLKFHEGVSGVGADGGLFLVGGTSANNILLLDTVENKLQLISKSFDGQKSANGASALKDISRDGRFIVFMSSATDLLSTQERKNIPINPIFPVNPLTGEPTYLAGVSRFYIYDRQTGSKRMVEGSSVSMSDNGRYYAFKLNRNKNDAYNNIAVYDYQSRRIKTLTRKANGFSGTPVISGDGRYVVFSTDATNLDQSVDMRPARLRNSGLISMLNDLQKGTNTMITINSNELKGVSDTLSESNRLQNMKGYVCDSYGWLNSNGSQLLCRLHNSNNFLVYSLTNGSNFKPINISPSNGISPSFFGAKEQDVAPQEGSSSSSQSSSGGANINKNRPYNPQDSINQTINNTRQLINQFKNLFR